MAEIAGPMTATRTRWQRALIATSLPTGHDTVLVPATLGKGKSAMFHDLGVFVTGRMARFITSKHPQGHAK
jgi:hypothetical protein